MHFSLELLLLLFIIVTGIRYPPVYVVPKLNMVLIEIVIVKIFFVLNIAIILITIVIWHKPVTFIDNITSVCTD